jgi:hypothetical protein
MKKLAERIQLNREPSTTAKLPSTRRARPVKALYQR